MKNNLKIISLFFFFATSSFAQLNDNAKLSDFSSLKSAPLLVVLKSSNTKEINELKAKINNSKNLKKKEILQKDLQNTIDDINTYNEKWKLVVEDIWKLNSSVEYKTLDEVDDLAKSGAKNYTVLMISDFNYSTTDFNSSLSSISTYRFEYIVYSNIQNLKKIKKADYFFIMQNIGIYTHSGDDYETKFKINLALAQKHILEIEKQKDTNLTIYDYAKQQKKANCKKLDQLVVNVSNNTLYKMARKDPNKSLSRGTLKPVDDNFIFKAIKNKEDVYIGIPFLESIGWYYKIIINTKTLEIISCTNRATAINEFLRIDLNSVSNCED